MAILEIVSNALIVLAYFFNPAAREKREKEKVWNIFNDLEKKLAEALHDKDMYTADKVRFWLREMRDKHEYLKEKK